MKGNIKIGIIGDFDKNRPYHQATNNALYHCADYLGIGIEPEWLDTELLAIPGTFDLSLYDGLWCSPGSPYKNMFGAINAIQYARTHNCVFIGTCGGMQHAAIEYAIHVLGYDKISPTENDPESLDLFITPLSCALLGERRTIHLLDSSAVHKIYQETDIEENYNCSFGINLEFQDKLDEHGFKIAGVDDNGEARVLEIPSNNFYITTLFQPQLSSTPDNPHKLILAYLSMAAGNM